MLVSDLTFHTHYKRDVEIARVLFSNGHWAMALRHRPGSALAELPCKKEEYVISYSLAPQLEVISSEIEMNVILSELRITLKSPLRDCPWEQEHIEE